MQRGGGSFTKFNNYLIGDILSVRPAEIGILALVLLAVAVIWCVGSNGLFLSVLHPNLAHSRGIQVGAVQALFTLVIAVVVTMALSWVGLLVINSLLVLPAAASRNFAKNLRQYHLFSVVGALVCGILGLMASYYWGCSTGAAGIAAAGGDISSWAFCCGGAGKEDAMLTVTNPVEIDQQEVSSWWGY